MVRLAGHAILGLAWLGVAISLGCGGDDDDDELPPDGQRADSAGDAGSGGWTTKAPLPGPRQETAVVAVEGKVYVIGGFSDAGAVGTVEVYDPATDMWTAAAALPRPLHHVNAVVVDGKIWVVGALEDIQFTAVGDVFSYDPGADAWTPGTPMPMGSQRGASAAASIGTKIYVAGGSRVSSVTDFSVYETTTGEWSMLPALPEARDHIVGGAVGGVVYVMGGRQAATTGVKGEVWAFDPAVGQWVPKTPMPTPRGGCSAAVLGDRVYVAGGEGNAADPSGVFDDTEAYEPATDSWSIHPPMITPRHGTGAATVGASFYVPGGATQQGFGFVPDNEAFTP